MNQNLEILERITIRSIEALERVCCEAARSLSGTSSMPSSGAVGPLVGGSVENTAGAAASSSVRSDRIRSAGIRSKEQSVSADKVSAVELNSDAISASTLSQAELSENAVKAAAIKKTEAEEPAEGDCSYPVELPDGTTTVCASFDELMEVYADALKEISGWKEIEAFNKLNGRVLLPLFKENGEPEERVEALRELASDAFNAAWKEHEAKTKKAEEPAAAETDSAPAEDEEDDTSFVVRNGRGTEVSTLNDPDEVVSVLSDAFAKCRKPDTVKTLLRHNEDMIASLPREQADAVLDASQVAIEELEAKAGKSKASEEKADAQEEAPQEREEPKSDKPKTLANDDEPSRDKLRELIQKIADTRGFSTAMSVLVNLGTGKLRDLPDDKIPEAYAAAKELLEADA